MGLTGSPGQRGENVSVTTGHVRDLNVLNARVSSQSCLCSLTSGCTRPRWTPRSRWSTGESGTHGMATLITTHWSQPVFTFTDLSLVVSL